MTRAKIAPSDTVAINAVLVAARQAIDVICDRWSLAVVEAALFGETRFGGFQARTGIGSRLLTARLRGLEAGGVLARETQGAERRRYRLTAMGLDLSDLMARMIGWERNWTPAPGPGVVHRVCDAPLRPRLRCKACGVLAGARDIVLSVSEAQLRLMPAKQTVHRRSTLNGQDQMAGRGGLGASLDVFGDKWGIEILLCAFFRIRRFNDFRLCTGISSNILADRLERLVAGGILARGREPAAEPGYWLTEKGIDLYGVVVAIQDWGDAWLPDRYRSPVSLIHRHCGKPFLALTTCAGCDQPVRPGEVAFG